LELRHWFIKRHSALKEGTYEIMTPYRFTSSSTGVVKY
jgi:hypothetical protein